ncbi:P-loop containing nucleoside triphosphate hydrolase protein [Thermoascus aurantiacus ATCC 26904]
MFMANLHHSGAHVRRSKKKQRQSKQKQKKKGIFDDPIIVDDDDDDDMTDWIPIVGHLMPGAKLTKARDIFRSIIEIFRFICENEQWGYALLTGDMSFTHRDASMQEFRGKPELRVMIASLKAGGIGIDMTMANKCILVDPWWNEAVQQQAFCRLFRIGQVKNVEVVKLVKDTIEDYILDMQIRKTAKIDKTIGEAALSSRATIAELLRMFGEVDENEAGAFTVIMDD